MPAEALVDTGQSAAFRVQAFDAKGNDLGPASGVTWSLSRLAGAIDEHGTLVPAVSPASQAGLVVARSGGLEATARVRVLQDLPIREDFESSVADSRPSYFMGYISRWLVQEQDGGKVLFKGPSPVQVHRHIVFLGKPALSEYTITSDLKAGTDGQQLADFGLINSGYTLELLGVHQKLQVLSWSSTLRMAREVDFAWEPDVWYRMKLRVEQHPDKAVIRGKVWRRDTAEPEAWSLTVEDPLPIRDGAPGLSGYSPVPTYYDNIEVTSNR
jgi:hypothetical protein